VRWCSAKFFPYTPLYIVSLDNMSSVVLKLFELNLCFFINCNIITYANDDLI
jgi:hypothetical protein